jgi:putative membrane protein
MKPAFGRFLIHWLATAIALAVAAWILPGVHLTSERALAIAAIVLGLVNALVRPVLFILTLPITVLTLGLFYFVVNGLAFALAARLVPGFSVDSFTQAMLGAVLVGLVSWFVGLSGRPRR